MPAPSEPVRAGAWGLDTNVLVRYLVGDDPEQQGASRRLIEEEHSSGYPLLLHPVMLVELIWVLRSAYGASKRELLEVLDMLLRVETLRILDEPDVREAVEAFRTHQADFADALLHVSSRRRGAEGLATFDLEAAALPGARLLGGR